ncbi:hypothetical protein QUF75_09180 [Desulfococcaceae bacterium HSG7]|nr:hypothetical protein [Desulfococcaceae bacterium HSG7]
MRRFKFIFACVCLIFIICIKPSLSQGCTGIASYSEIRNWVIEVMNKVIVDLTLNSFVDAAESDKRIALRVLSKWKDGNSFLTDCDIASICSEMNREMDNMRIICDADTSNYTVRLRARWLPF